MARGLVMTCMLLACLALWPSPAAAGAVTVKRCGGTTITTPDGIVLWRIVAIRAYRVTCARARGIARDWTSASEGADTDPRPRGYRCYRQRTGRVYCARGTSSSVSWGYGARSSATVAAGASRWRAPREAPSHHPDPRAEDRGWAAPHGKRVL
jgi:hypothetical protein